MTKLYQRTSATLYRQDYEYLLAENEDLVRAIEADIAEGADPDAITRFITREVGDHRVGTIRRCTNAIQHIKSVQAR